MMPVRAAGRDLLVERQLLEEIGDLHAEQLGGAVGAAHDALEIAARDDRVELSVRPERGRAQRRADDRQARDLRAAA